MMKRRTFFWIEQLKISRAERLAVGGLLVMLAVLMLVNVTLTPSPAVNRSYYRELNARFTQRSLLQEQQRRHILSRYAGAQPDTLNSDTLSVQRDSAMRVDINSADMETLQQLQGVGAAYARRIVAYRQRQGGFNSVEELLEVKGIGPARMEKLRPWIMVAPFDSAKVRPESVFPADRSEERPRQVVDEQTIVNINKADTTTLQQLPGIGPAYAHRIITYRLENGPFTNVEQLLEIKGIGKKRLAKIKPFIKLTD